MITCQYIHLYDICIVDCKCKHPVIISLVKVEFLLNVLSAVVADVQGLGLGAVVAGLVATGREGDVVRSLQTDLAEVLLLQVLVSDTTWLSVGVQQTTSESSSIAQWPFLTSYSRGQLGVMEGRVTDHIYFRGGGW